MKTQDQDCCPEFDVKKWDNKTVVWDRKPFIQESIPTFFHVPLVSMIGKKMKKMSDLTAAAKADIPNRSDALVLFHDPSAFKSEIYYSVTKEVEGANNVSLTGTYVAGVFDGPYNAIPRHIKEMNGRLAKENKKAKDYLVHYAYCPACAKKFGSNYTVLFAEV